MLTYVLICCLLIYAEGRPRDRRYRRDEDVGGITYAPCRDTYSQCPEWKKSGMCDMPQYKDYMPLVCTDTCGFCKDVKQEELAADTSSNKDESQTPKQFIPVVASADTAPALDDYQSQLKKYYENIDQQQKAYQASIQYTQSTSTPVSTETTETGTANAAIPDTGSSATASALPVSVDVPSATTYAPGTPVAFVAQYPGYGDPAASAASSYPAASSYQPYGAQPYQPYGGSYGSPDNSSSSSSTSASSGSKSSSSSSTSTDSSSSTSTSTGQLNSANQTEAAAATANNVSASEASSILPSKVAPETPSLPALPPLLVLPPISDSLLVDDSTKATNTTTATAVDNKDPADRQKADLQQADDAKPYAPELSKEESIKAEVGTKESLKETPKEEVSKIKHKTHVKSESDRKAVTEDESTNEMTRSVSKHLSHLLPGHKLEGGSEEEEDQKMVKAFSNDSGKLQMSKGVIKKKNSDVDLKVPVKEPKESKRKRSHSKREKKKSYENEDAVFKHDEKSVSVSGSGAGGNLEDNFEDLNYITDFNPDDFDMDLTDISHKDLLDENADKRDAVVFPKDHPLFSHHTGVQKARSEITAPTIIDATEHGAGGAVRAPSNHWDDNTRREKIHSGKSSSHSAIKAEEEETELPEEEEEEGEEEEAEPEESSGSELEEKSVDKDANAKAKKEIKKEKKTVVKSQAKEKKGKTAEKKSESVSTKGKTVANKKSKVHAKKVDKKESKELSKEKSEVSELMSEKGDTAAVKNEKVEKKSPTEVTKKLHKSKVVTSRKEIPETKVKTEVATKKSTTSTDDIELSTADLSGAGSGESDNDLSGDAPERSNIVASAGSGTGDLTSQDSDEEEDDGEDDVDDDEETAAAHQRHNFQLNGDPEMVDLKPKKSKPQPDLNDFPDEKDEATSSFSKDDDEPEKEDAADAATVVKVKDRESAGKDEAELDDLKIEELLADDDAKTVKKPVKAKAAKKKAEKKTGKKTGKTEKAKAVLKEGKISFVLSQNFQALYEKKDSPNYQMLSGNVKKDIEKMVKGTAVRDVNFSEVSVEGNPRQSGKTKVSFNIDASSDEWMKRLLKMVDGGDIDGLKVIKGSLEIEEE